MSGRQKIIVVGPCEAGKTTIANVLAETTDTASEAYRPTVGVRIVEFEAEVRVDSQRVTVELWDASGDRKSQKCWPAIRNDAVGCVLVYNPEKGNHEQEIEQWYHAFAGPLKLVASQVMVIQSIRRSDAPRRMPLPAKLATLGIGQPTVVPADDLTCVRKHFGQFLENLRQSVVDKQRQEEEDVMKGGG